MDKKTSFNSPRYTSGIYMALQHCSSLPWNQIHSLLAVLLCQPFNWSKKRHPAAHGPRGATCASVVFSSARASDFIDWPDKPQIPYSHLVRVALAFIIHHPVFDISSHWVPWQRFTWGHLGSYGRCGCEGLGKRHVGPRRTWPAVAESTWDWLDLLYS